MLVNNRVVTDFTLPSGVEIIDSRASISSRVNILNADLVSDATPWRHNSAKLAAAVIALAKHEKATNRPEMA
jgi:hypothetical protein